MSSFFASAKAMATKAKDRVVDSAKKGYSAGQNQGNRAADNIETRTASKSTSSSAESDEQGGAQGSGTAGEDLPVRTTDNENATGETKEKTWKKAVKVTGGVFGALAGVAVGVGRAAYGVPKDIMRDRAKAQQLDGFESGWGPRECEFIFVLFYFYLIFSDFFHRQHFTYRYTYCIYLYIVYFTVRRLHAPAGFPLEKMPVRVVCVRHGHGFHNDVGGLSNVGNRDALLSPLGIEQSQALGSELRDVPFDMIVVSPMRRTLQTSIHVLGDKATSAKTIIQPMAAEHNGGTFTNDRMNQARSVVARGDLGSTPETLRTSFPFDQYPQFSEFSSLNENWWEHDQPDGFETSESFDERATAFRKWLGSTGRTLASKKRASECFGDGLPTILLISHGGILSKTFQFELDGTKEVRSGGKMQNCEIRIFDVCEGGDFVRPIASGEDSTTEVESGGSGGGGTGGGGSGSGSGGSGDAAFVDADKSEPSKLTQPIRPPRPSRS